VSNVLVPCYRPVFHSSHALAGSFDQQLKRRPPNAMVRVLLLSGVCNYGLLFLGSVSITLTVIAAKTLISHMTKRITLIAGFLFFFFVGFSQIPDTSWTRELHLKTPSSIKPHKRISLFESESFIVYSTFNLVVAKIKESMDQNNVEEDSLLLNMFFNTSRSLDRNIKQIQSDRILKFYLDFKTVDLLKQKKCLVYNKISKRFETKIFVVNYVKKSRKGVKFLNESNQQILDLLTAVF
jgi:hypothetical protein